MVELAKPSAPKKAANRATDLEVMGTAGIAIDPAKAMYRFQPAL